MQVWRFDVKNDNDVRDAVVADDGGAASGPMRPRGMAAPKLTTVTEFSRTHEDVEPHQRLRAESPKVSNRPRRKCALKLAIRISAMLYSK